MGHDNLGNYFRTNFALMQFHKWNLTELETMVPWEKSIYVTLLQEHLKEEEIKMKQLENERKNQMNAMRSQQAAQARRR